MAELAGRVAVAGSELGVLRAEAAGKGALLGRVEGDAARARGRRDALAQTMSRCAQCLRRHAPNLHRLHLPLRTGLSRPPTTMQITALCHTTL